MIRKILFFMLLYMLSSTLMALENFSNRSHSNINLEFNGNSQWVIRKDRMYGSSSVNICQKNSNKQCLHVENGYLQLGEIQDVWWSSLWNLKSSDSDFIRIQNKWKPEQYLHIEGGNLQSGEIENHWHSPQWKRSTISKNHNKVKYETINKDVTYLYPYDGRNISILLQNNNYDEEVMKSLLKAFDNAYDEFENITGRKPASSKQERNGLLIIAEPEAKFLPNVGAHAYTSKAGIEMSSAVFLSLYNGVRENNTFEQAVFYELGRNFWFYTRQIGARKDFTIPNSPSSNNGFIVGTGYAIFMRHWIMNKIGVNGRFNGGSLSNMERSIKDLITEYISEDSYTFNNTVVLNRSTRSDRSGADMFASFLFSLSDTYGDSFVTKLWKEVENGKNATSKYSSTDNFIVAASKAANKDLRSTFKTWKWPSIGKKSNDILDNLFTTNTEKNEVIESFYSKYSSYFGQKTKVNYSCFNSYTCQDFLNGSKTKKIAVRESDNLIWYFTGSRWNKWGYLN